MRNRTRLHRAVRRLAKGTRGRLKTKSSPFMPGSVALDRILWESPWQTLLTALLSVWSGMAEAHAAQMAISYGMDSRGI